MTNQAENYRRQHETLKQQLTTPDRIMTVCEVCGVFISSTDNDQRRLVSGQAINVTYHSIYFLVRLRGAGSLDKYWEKRAPHHCGLPCGSMQCHAT